MVVAVGLISAALLLVFHATSNEPRSSANAASPPTVVASSHASDEVVTVSDGAGGTAYVASVRRSLKSSRKVPGSARAAVSRMGRDGKLDRSFGRNGTVATSWKRGHDLLVRDIAPTREGGVVVLGLADFTSGKSKQSTDKHPVVYRLTKSGALDKKFGRSGFAVLGASNEYGDTSASGVKVRPNGSIAFASDFGRTSLYVVQLTRDGVLDRRFASNGIERIASNVGPPVGIALLGKGTIVAVSGKAISRHSDTAGCLAIAITSSGRLDRRFGDQGKLSIGGKPGPTYVCSPPQSAARNRFVLSGISGFPGNGDSPSSLFAQRFDEHGMPDTSWNSGAIGTIEIGAQDVWTANVKSCVTTDGSVVFPGIGSNGNISFRTSGSYSEALSSQIGNQLPLLKSGRAVCASTDDHLVVAANPSSKPNSSAFQRARIDE